MNRTLATHTCRCWGDGICSSFDDGETSAPHPEGAQCEGCDCCQGWCECDRNGNGERAAMPAGRRKS